MKKILLSFTFVLTAVAVWAAPVAARGKSAPVKSSPSSLAAVVEQRVENASPRQSSDGGRIQYASGACESAPKIHFNGKDLKLQCPALEPWFGEEGEEIAFNLYCRDVPFDQCTTYIDIRWESNWLDKQENGQTRRDEFATLLPQLLDSFNSEVIETLNRDIVIIWLDPADEKYNYSRLGMNRISAQGDMWISVAVPDKIEKDESKFKSWREKLIQEAIKLPFPKPYKGTRKRE